MKILLIEDDKQALEIIELTLRLAWPQARIWYSRLGEEGLELFERESPDLVILDLGLPDISGYEVLKSIRLFSNIPILILTVSDDEPSIVKGFELGADDYIVKPFRQAELLSRIKAVLRRTHILMEMPARDYGDFILDVSMRKVIYRHRSIDLTPSEATILLTLLKNRGKVITYKALAEALWDTDYPDSKKAIRLYILQLRKKIEKDFTDPKLIITKPGFGYSIIEKVSSTPA